MPRPELAHVHARRATAFMVNVVALPRSSLARRVWTRTGKAAFALDLHGYFLGPVFVLSGGIAKTMSLLICWLPRFARLSLLSGPIL